MTVLIVSATVAGWYYSTGATLAEKGLSGTVVVQLPSPGLSEAGMLSQDQRQSPWKRNAEDKRRLPENAVSLPGRGTP